MWQMMVGQAVASGVSAYMKEKSNKQLEGLQKKLTSRRERSIRDNSNLQLEAIGENFTYQMQMMARNYTEGMSALNREVRTKKSSINYGTSGTKGVTTQESSFAQDMKNELNSQYNEAVVIHGAVQEENIDKLSKMNLDSRINLIKETTAQIIEGRYNLANSLSSIAQSTQNAYSQAGLSMMGAGASVGMDALSKHARGSQSGGTINPDNTLKLQGIPEVEFDTSKTNTYQGMSYQKDFSFNRGGYQGWNS